MRRSVVTVVLTALVVILPLQVWAQGTTTKTKKDRPAQVAKPLVIFNVASINRLLDDAAFIFKEIDRPELMDFVGAGLANLRDFKGIDREKSGGLMIFLAEGLLPQPVPIAFVPVTDIGELNQTLANTPVKLQKSPDAEDRYELIPQNGPKQYVRLVHGYALITQTAEHLEREFANPADFANPLSNRYDVAVSLNLKSTPDGVKTLLLGALRASTQAGMQQRDGEADGAYRFRKAQTEGNLHFFEGVLKDGEEATIGAKVDREQRKASLELIVRAKADTAFAKELMGAAKPSYFAAAIDSNVPLSLSISGEIQETQKKQYREFFAVGELESNRGFAKLPATAKKDEIPELESLKSFFASLKATSEAGHLDGFMQFHGDPEKSFSIIGGVRLIEARKFGEGLQDILTRLKNETTPFSIELGATSYGEVVFHRLTPNSVGQSEQRVYGEKPAGYIGTDNNAVWFAFGGDDAMTKLKATIDKVEASKAHAPKTDDLAPFQLVLNLSQWVKLNANKVEKPGPLNELAQKAFNDAGNDVLRMDVRPIENGFRMRVQVENGFLRLLGLGIARAIDGRQEL